MTGLSTPRRHMLFRRYQMKYPVAMERTASHLCSRICESEYTLTAAIACFQYHLIDFPSRYCATRSPARATSAQKRSSSEVATTGGCSDLIRVLLAGPRDSATCWSASAARPGLRG